MGNCVFCGKPAGFLRKRHKECQKKFELGKSRIISLIESSVSNDMSLDTLKQKLRQVSNSHFIDEKNLRSILLKGWESAVGRAFDDGILTEKEESLLNKLAEHFSLTQHDLDRSGTYTKLVKGAILRDVLDGKIPERVNIQGNLPFNSQKTEKLIWLFQRVD